MDILQGKKTYIGAIGLLLAGVACALQHYGAGDLADHWTDCLTKAMESLSIVGLRAAISRIPAA